MIRDLPNGLKARKPEEHKPKSLQALQQQEAVKNLDKPGQDNQSLRANEQVQYSKELSDDLQGAWKQEDHQGLGALLANFGLQEPKKVEANDQVREIARGGDPAKLKEHPEKKWVVRDSREDEKRKDPKAADRLGNLKVSSKKESQGLRDKPQTPSSEQSHSHHKAGSKGAPKTDAPYPVGAPEQNKGSKPDGKTGQRQLPQLRHPSNDRVELSEESQLAGSR